MLDYIANNQAEFWLIVGFALLALEVLMGFAAGMFLFAGLGALTCGLFMLAGVFPDTWIAGISVSSISAAVLAILLWKPLKKLQGDKAPEKDNSSDLVGYEFVLAQDISTVSQGQTRYSGIVWRVVLDPDSGVDMMSAGQTVTVSSVDVGVFKVKPRA